MQKQDKIILDKIDGMLHKYATSHYANKIIKKLTPPFKKHGLFPTTIYALYDGILERTEKTISVAIECGIAPWIDPELVQSEKQMDAFLEQGSFIHILIDLKLPRNITSLSQEQFNKLLYERIAYYLQPSLSKLDELLTNFAVKPERKKILSLAKKSYLRIKLKKTK